MGVVDGDLATPRGMLAGLKVVDLTGSLPSSIATQLLADFGAEVVLVEPPGGSPLRRHPAFPFWGRGKKSIELDLKTDADREVALRLARGADVVVEGWRPGVADRLGVGGEALRRHSPGLVYASVTGFGSIGPLANLKGYEALVAAKVGVPFQISQVVDRPGPAFASVHYAAYATAQCTLHGILAALYERASSGVGQHVETNMAQGFASIDIWNWFLQLVGQRFPDAFTPVTLFSDAGQPNSPYPMMLLVALTADGHWLQFSQTRPKLFRALMRALGLESLFDDPAWPGLPLLADPARRMDLWERMLSAARGRTLVEWQQVFDEDPDVWAEQFRSGAGILDHPQLAHNGQVLEIVDAERGPTRQPGPLVIADGTPALIERGAPLRNEHEAELRARAAVAAESGPVGEPPVGRPPLDGVTILDLGFLFAAPYGSTVLTDLGARVIHVEPLDGDPVRGMLEFPEAAGVKAMQGKESIAVDFTTAAGRRTIEQLAARADVVLQSFRAGVAEKYGLDADALRRINPNLIYVNAPGYGVDGPCGNRPALANTIAAGAGVARRNAGNLVPEHPGLTLAEVRTESRRLASATGTSSITPDGLSGVSAATAILLGLLGRQRGAGAQTLMTSMLSSVVHALGDVVMDTEGTGPVADGELLGFDALYRLYETAQGWVFLAAPSPGEWPALVAALREHVDLAGDPRFATPEDRRAHDAELAATLAGVFAGRPAVDWERALTAVDVGCVEVDARQPELILMSEEFGGAGGYLATVTHPTFDEHPRLAPFVRLSRSATTAKPGCLAGQHTLAILAELGYPPDEIAGLLDADIVRTG